MKTNEIKRTVEEVVRVEYIAEDGQVFKSEEECRKYEDSALFAVSRQLKKLNTKHINQNILFGVGDEESEVEVFDVQTDADMENLRRYLYLTLIKNGADENWAKGCFTSENGKRKDWVFEGVTKGHEVIIFWSYEKDWFWVYRDGSLNGFFEYVKDMMKEFTAPKTVEE